VCLLARYIALLLSLRIKSIFLENGVNLEGVPRAAHPTLSLCSVSESGRSGEDQSVDQITQLSTRLVMVSERKAAPGVRTDD
jgi:hypothetical protein